ncbi:ATP-binding cassette sub-family A member 3, partial [Orchesella cincta]
MIAGKVMPTTGQCHINDMSLTHKRKEYLSCIGHCPKKNYLFEELTGKEMLQLMGCLRGVPDDLLNNHVQKWLSVFGLEEVADDKCKSYAHGIRQRLGAAMAFIGEPDIILLDEPTSGVDAASRERMWAVMEHLNKQGHTIIFTTYSCDEAYALAEKVAVVAEGNMQCVGGPDQLQNKYDRGHILTFKVKHELLCTLELAAATMTQLKDFKSKVQETFTHIDLLDEHDDRLMYFLRDSRFTLGDLFLRAQFLALTYDVLVDSYDVSESRIEDVFIFMTKKYHELDKPRKSDRSIFDIVKQAGEPPFLKQQHEVTNLPTNTE